MIVTLNCGVDRACDWTTTDEAVLAQAQQRRHEARHVVRIRDVEASPAWAPYREPAATLRRED